MAPCIHFPYKANCRTGVLHVLGFMLAPFGLFRRHLSLSLGLAALALTLAAGVGVYAYRRHQINEAESAIQRRDYIEARRHVQAALEIWSADASVQLLAARIERLNGAYAEAEKYLGEYKRLNGGTSADAQDEWLMLRAMNNELDEVAPLLLNAVSQDHPRKLEMLEALARASMRDMRYRQALDYLDRWLSFEPDDACALDWRSWVYSHLFEDQKQTLAVADAERSLALQPDRHNLRLRLVDMLLDNKNMAAAVGHAEFAVAEKPDDPDALVALARCRVLQAASDDGKQLLERALALKPDHATALLELAKIHNRNGSPAEAERLIRLALQQEPDDGVLLFVLCESLRLQDKDEAEIKMWSARNDQVRADLDLVENFLRHEAESPMRTTDQAATAGSALLRLHQDRLGMQWLGVALKQDSRNPTAHLALAEFFEEKGETGPAQQHRQQVQGRLKALGLVVGCPLAATPWGK